MPKVYLGLGGNLGDPLRCFQHVLQACADLGTVVARSGIYRTAPVGGPEQPDYYNAVIAIESDAGCEEILRWALRTERECGRVRHERWGARTLDIDVLLCGECVAHSATLRVPHPRMAARRFVLEPLLEIAPRIAIPGYGMAADLLDAVRGQHVERLGSWPEEVHHGE